MASAIDSLPTISSCQAVSQINLATARWAPHTGYERSGNLPGHCRDAFAFGLSRDQRKEHETRLGNFMRALRDDLAKDGSSWLVTPACVPKPCSLAGSTVTDLLAAAREAGADILLIGGVHKMSTLVQNAKVEAIDARTGRVMFDKLFTFRGDTDEAWRRAEIFIANEIAGVS